MADGRAAADFVVLLRRRRMLGSHLLDAGHAGAPQRSGSGNATGRRREAPGRKMSGVAALFLAAFLLCSPDANRARPADARTRRSVTHAQLMHDKGRTLQDLKRRMWLQELLDEVHTAEIRQPPPPPPPLSKAPPAPGKGPPSDRSAEIRRAADLPQETHESSKEAKRRKKGRPGKRKDADKRKRRARSPAPPPAPGWPPARRRGKLL